MAELTVEQAEYFLEHIPYLDARDNHAIAQLIADLREFIFPRYLDPDPNEKKEPPRRREPWTVVETLPPHAKYPEPEPMPQEAAKALVEAYDALPAWARKIVPLDEAKAVLAGAAAPPLTPGELSPG